MSDSDSDGDVPPREVCEERCQEFATVTGTDSALAMFYLQDRDWDLTKSVNAYFEEHGGSPGAAGSLAGSTVTVGLTENGTAAPGATHIPKPEVDPEPRRIRLLSWNIDGLDTNNLETRTKGVCDTITKERPHVVFLQEVVPMSLEILEEGCPQYQMVTGGGSGYFTAIMLHCAAVQYEEHEVQQFFSSVMSRNLLKCKVTVKGVKCLLITAHLESTKAHAAERKKQLQAGFSQMTAADPERAVIFGGDLNLRDKELAEINGLPTGIHDLWEVTGKRPEARYTWDTFRNDNLGASYGGKCRFDRLYLRSDRGRSLKTVYFELVGLQRLTACKRFCSDHWGILSHFDKLGS